jgi:hypothetical protein
VIKIEISTDRARLERMKDVPVVDGADAAVPGKIGTRPVIDEIVAERMARAVGQASLRVPIEDETEGGARHRDPGNGDDAQPVG